MASVEGSVEGSVEAPTTGEVAGIRLVKAITVKRAGVPIDQFSTLVSPIEAAKLLTPPHTYAEYFHGDQATKLYFDTERYYDAIPTAEIHDAYLAEVERAMQTIVDVLSGVQPDVSYHIAQRHGMCKGRPKLSFRTFVSGVSVVYHEIPRILHHHPVLRETLPLWDLSVYKASEQLLSAIHGCKTKEDRRVLTPILGAEGTEGPVNVLDYVASHVEPDWPGPMRCPDDDGVGSAAEGDVSFVSGECDPRILELVALLGEPTASDRAKWLNVAIFLKAADGGGDAYLEAWLEFSAKCKDKYNGRSDCIKTWKSLRSGGGGNGAGRRALTLGTLRYYAKRDDPTGYAAWREAAKHPGPSISSPRDVEPVADDKRIALLEALRARFPDSLGSLDQASFVVSKVEDCVGAIAFEDPPVGIAGTVSPDFTVNVKLKKEPERFLGLLFTDVTIKGPLCDVNASIPTDADFVLNRVQKDHATLKSVAPNLATTITRFYRGDNSYLKVELPGKQPSNVRGKKIVACFNDRVDSAIAEHAESNNMGWIINYGIVNNNNITIHGSGDPASSNRSDTDMIRDVLAANPDLLETVKFAPDVKSDNSNGLYVCDRETNLWSQWPNLAIEKMLVEAFDLVDDMTPAERRHVRGRRGRADMVRMLAGEVIDTRFLDLLDANLDLFATSNGVFDSSAEVLLANGGRPVFRPIKKDDYISKTTGWAYDADKAKEHRAEVDDFLAKILPVPEERRVVLAFFATLLSGRRELKKFLVLTDRRSGNNGKTSLMTLVLTFLGSYGKINTKFVCRGAFDRDRDSHDAGLEPIKGVRLIAAEELKKSMTLDEGFLKSKAGGAGIVVEGRRCGTSDQFRYVWQAAFVLVFNEGDCPKFDQEDTAFVGRMLVAPMRSKFVEVLPQDGGESNEWTYKVDTSITGKFSKWTSALADVLLDHFGAIGHVFDQLPVAMREWRHEVASDNNPVAEWCRENLTVTGDSKDVVLLGEVTTYDGDRKTFVPLVRAFFNGVPGVTYIPTTSVANQGKKRNVLRGVAYNV